MLKPGSRTTNAAAWIAAGAAQSDVAARDPLRSHAANPVVEAIGARQQVRVVATYSDGTRARRHPRSVRRKRQHRRRENRARAARLARSAAPRRGGRARALRRKLRGHDAHRDGRPQRLRLGRTAGEQSHRRAGGREAASARRRCPRRSRTTTNSSAACTSTSPACRRRPSRFKRSSTMRASRGPSATRSSTQLVGSDDYIEFWTNKWADLLMVNRKFLGVEGATALRNWIRGELAATRRTTSSCARFSPPPVRPRTTRPASYFKMLRTPQALMENTTHLFLATRFNCNKCHDHPFERWTQDQYYHLAAYFAQVELSKDPASGDAMIGGSAVEAGQPLYEIVADSPQGEVKHDRTGAVTAAGVPVRVQARNERRRDASRAAGRVDHVARQSVLRQELCESHLGLPDGPRHHRAARRHPRRQPADESGAARLSHRRVHQERLQHAARDAADLQVAHVPTFGRNEQVERRRPDQLLARPRPPAAGRSAVRRDLSRDRRDVGVPGVVAGSPGGHAAGRRRRTCRTVSSATWAGRPAKAPANASGAAICSSAP